jgi:CheY-like chemotaxis protein
VRREDDGLRGLAGVLEENRGAPPPGEKGEKEKRRPEIKVEIASVAVVTKNRLFFENVSGALAEEAAEVRMVSPDDDTLRLAGLDADLALVDVDSVDFQEWRALGLAVPAAAVGRPERGRVYECLRLGCRDFVCKPVDNRRLAEALQRARLGPVAAAAPGKRDWKSLEALSVDLSAKTGLELSLVREFVLAMSFGCMPKDAV